MSFASSVASLGIVGGLSAIAYLLFNNTAKSKMLKQDEEIDQIPIQEMIKEVYLKVNTKENMAVVLDLYNLDCAGKQQLLKPYDYTLKTGGKKIRLIMAVIVSEMFIGESSKIPKQVLQIGGLIELLHSASLIIDDIEDGSQQRRGEPCSYLVYGLDRSINAANLMYFLPLKKLYESINDPMKKLKILSIFMEEMVVSHMGQAQDIRVHKLKKAEDLPVLEQYETLTIAKTSSLLRMMVRMLCVLLDRTQQQSAKLSQVMNYVGLSFQVTDDVLNLTKNLGKGQMAEDLREKKFTPIINFMRNNEKFISLFIIDNKDDETIKLMLQMITNSDALKETKQLAEKYETIAQRLIENLSTPYSKKKFEKLMKFVISRDN